MQQGTIRAAFITFAPFISGSERCLQLMLAHCQAHQIEPVLILPSTSPLAHWAERHQVEYVTVAIDNIQAKNIFQRIVLNIRLCAILIKHKIDVIHSNQIWSLKPIASAAKLLKIPTVCHFRDPIDNGSRWWFDKGCDTAIFISQYIANQFFATFDPDVIKEHITQIDPIASPPSQDTETKNLLREHVRKQHQISPSSFVFGFFGQIAPVKGITQLIEALNLVEAKNWTLLIAGKAPAQHQNYYAECQQLVNRYGLSDNVKFLGFVDSVSDIYAAIDIAVAPSLDEPLGLIPLEAGINGVPSIVANVGGLPETIIENETGLLVNVHNKEEFSRKLSLAIEQPDKEMGLRARELVSERCSVPLYMEKLRTLFSQTIETKQAAR